MQQDSVPKLISRRYRYVRELGAGGMGRVILVEDLEQDGLRCALKWVRSRDPSATKVRRHQGEFAILSRFQHPNILPVFSFERLDDEGLQYFTSAYVPGPCLATVVGTLDPTCMASVADQLLRAVGFLHAQRVVHGDLKPQNILFQSVPERGTRPQLCLIDFGLSEFECQATDRQILGSVHYMSPERLRGATLDHRSDLYTVGILLYQLLTGELPFSGKRREDVVQGHLEACPIALSDLCRELSPRLEALVLALLEKEPGNRPQSAEEVHRVLRAEWGAAMAGESCEDLSAYIRNGDFSGWEAHLQLLTGKVLQRGSEPQQLSAVLDGNTRDGLPLPVGPCGRTGVGLVQFSSSCPADRDLFKKAVDRRLRVLGVPTIRVSVASHSLHADLVRGALGLVAEDALEEGAVVHRLASRLDAGVDRGVDESVREELLTGIILWLARVARARPFVVVLAGPGCGSDVHALLAEARQQEPAVPALRSICWLGLQLDSGANRDDWRETREIRGLDPEAMTRWLSARFGDWAVPTNLRSLLELEAEGRPARMEHLLCGLIRAGTLARDAGGWTLDLSDVRGAPMEAEPVEACVTLCTEGPTDAAAAWRAVAAGQYYTGMRIVELLLRSDALESSKRVGLLGILADLRQRWGPIETSRELRHGLGLPDGQKLALSEALLGEYREARSRLQAAGPLTPVAERRSVLLQIELALALDGVVPDRLWANLESLGAIVDPCHIGWQGEFRVCDSLSRGDTAAARHHGQVALVTLETASGAASPAWGAYLLGRRCELDARLQLAAAQYRLACWLFGRSRQPRLQLRSILRLAEVTGARSHYGESGGYRARALDLLAQVGGVTERIWVQDFSPTDGVRTQDLFPLSENSV